MRRYFFHLRNNAGWSRDQAGSLLANEAEAIAEALRAARLLMQSSSDAPSDWRGWTLQVTDESGTVLFVLPFSSVKAVSG